MAAPGTVPAPSPPLRPPPASGEEFLFRLMDEIATSKTQEERAGRMQAFIQDAMGQLRGALLRHEIDDDEIRVAAQQYLDEVDGDRLEKLFHPEELPWHERENRMREGVSANEQWTDSYRMQCAKMAPVMQKLVGFLYGADILQQRRESLARAIEEAEHQWGMTITNGELAKIQKRLEEANGDGEAEPKETHSADQEPEVQNAKLRQGPRWVVIERPNPVRTDQAPT